MKTTIKKLLAMVNLRVGREDSSAINRWTMAAALARCRNLGAAPATVIDLGAAEGKWSAMARKAFPGSTLLLCEPLPDRRDELLAFCRSDGNALLTTSVIGASDGESPFNRSDDLDSSGVYEEQDEGTEMFTLPMRSIDSLAKEHWLA